MARMRAPGPASATVDLVELGAAWLQGLNTSHDAGCGCGGLFAPELNAKIIEEDFLDYLFSRYEREKLGELAVFVAARRKNAPRGDKDRNSFERWITALDEAKIGDAHRARLVADIRTFVESMGGARRAPGICY